MKLAFAAAFIAGISTSASAQTTVNETKFGLVNNYYTDVDNGSGFLPDTLGGGSQHYLGGGFIHENNLYLQLGVETDASVLAKIPITRNATNGKILAFDFSAATEVLAQAQMENGFQNVGREGPNGQVFWSTAEGVVPDGLTHGTFDPTTETVTPTYSAPASSFDGITNLTGVYGSAFSSRPDYLDPNTNHGQMVGTARFGFWQVGLQDVGTGSPNYEPDPTNTKLLCDLPTRYPGGVAYVPSGSFKDSVFFSDYSNYAVKLLKLDYSDPATMGYYVDKDTQLPALGTANPDLIDFATGFDGEPWGFIFDPQTNDFFVTTFFYGLYHFQGFPPGIDFGVVVANIEDALGVIINQIPASRRELFQKQEPNVEQRNLRRRRRSWCEKLNRQWKKFFGYEKFSCPTPSPPSNPTPSPTSNPTSSPTSSPVLGPVEESIGSAEDIENDLSAALTNGDEAAFKASIAGPLTQTFSNPSFAEDVLSGGDSPAFTENINKVETAIDNLAASTAITDLTGEAATIVNGKFDEIKALTALLKGVVEA